MSNAIVLLNLNLEEHLTSMKVTITKALFFLLLLIASQIKAQTAPEFEKDFQQLVNKNYPPNEVDSLFKKYNSLLFFFNSNSRLSATLLGKETSDYPLTYFRSAALYQNNIDPLLQDTAYYKSNLGCFLAAASNDVSKIPQIESILSKSNYTHFWAANILAVLKTKNIKPLIETILVYEGKEAAPYLIAPFLQLDSTVIESFSLDSIRSKNLFVQYLAIRAMAKGQYTITKDSLLRNVVTNGAEGLKGWAISVLSFFNSQDMAGLVQPYLDNNDLRGISLRALANSSSIKDEAFLDNLLKNDTADRDLLAALQQSNQEKMVRKWLYALREKKIAADYYPFIERTPGVKQEVYFDEVCETLTKTKNQMKIYPLYNYFSGRNDERSVNFLIKCLSRPDQDRMVKHAIIRNLGGKNSELVRQQLPALMKNATIKDVELVYLLLEYKNKDYRDIVGTWVNAGQLEEAYKTLCNQYLAL